MPFCQPRAGWLYVGKMAVTPEQQRSGVGGMLIAEARTLAVVAGLDGLELETRIELVENHQAFGRLGFVKVGEQSHAGYSTATSITMRLPIS